MVLLVGRLARHKEVETFGLSAIAALSRFFASLELLYFPGAGANLAAGIRAAVAQPDRRAAMRHAALTFAATRGWDRIFDDLIADYRMAIAEARGALPPVAAAHAVPV